MIEGKCPECRQKYYGWALLQPHNQSCDKCGAQLVITEEGKRMPKYELKVLSNT